ncbi:hypothetical protein CD29_18185 [Ureibacillus manganicus DSM 26584]|uniref:TM2 domain-containing protein n=2 Tax=Ureibacillus TaxID=160795 RepID=A0A0A3HS77_9BACL|nr:hypothetical protein CD29_18185 [Ureibacillus manganicus DSM 26584]
MKNNKCSQCGAPRDPNAPQCKYCGEKFATTTPNFKISAQDNISPTYVQPSYPQYQNHGRQMIGIQPYWPIKNKTVAGLLGIFLGGFGIHKFYLGKPASGILYLVFCWTYIPAIVGFFEGIVYIASNNQTFQMKHKVRLNEYTDYH